MNPSKPISSGLREVFTAFKRMIAPTAEADQGFMRHDPLDQDSDTVYWSERRYLEDLKNEIFDSVREGAFLWEMPALVWSERLYSEIDWPHDEAAVLLDAWRISLAQQQEAA